MTCYAEDLAENGVAKRGYPLGFEHYYWRPHQLKELVRGKEPKLIFCDSMSDMFAPNVPEEHVREILATMRLAPHHTYQSLTKAAPQLLKYVKDLPPNLWVGVSSPPDWMMGSQLSRTQQESMLRRGLEGGWYARANHIHRIGLPSRPGPMVCRPLFILAECRGQPSGRFKWHMNAIDHRESAKSALGQRNPIQRRMMRSIW